MNSLAFNLLDRTPVGNTLKRKFIQAFQPMNMELEEDRGHHSHRTLKIQNIPTFADSNNSGLATAESSEIAVNSE